MHFSYPIHCTVRGCPHPARYKIAARWSDGLTEELKTYGLTCESCLPAVFRDSLEKQCQCHTTIGESLECAGIYLLAHGRRDGQLERQPDLEAEMRR